VTKKSIKNGKKNSTDEAVYRNTGHRKRDGNEQLEDRLSTITD
jgi:hypothetical protein